MQPDNISFVWQSSHGSTNLSFLASKLLLYEIMRIARRFRGWLRLSHFYTKVVNELFHNYCMGRYPLDTFQSGEGNVYIHWRKPHKKQTKDGIGVRWFDMSQYRFAGVTTISEGKSHDDIVTYSNIDDGHVILWCGMPTVIDGMDQ